MTVLMKQYAQALYEVATDKKKGEVTELVDSLLGILQEKNLLSHINELLTAVEDLDDEAHGRLQVLLTSAERLDESILRQIEKVLKQRTGAQEIVWHKEIKPELLGGVIIKYNDTVLDISLTTRLNELVEKINS